MICPHCEWEISGRPLKRCPRCKKRMDGVAPAPSPTPPNNVAQSVPASSAPFTVDSLLPITAITADTPANVGQTVPEEKLPEGISPEQAADAKESGPIGEAALALAETVSNANPETLTAEEARDMLVAFHELQSVPIVMLKGKDVPDSDDPKVAKHLDRGGRALHRLFKRHPDWYKGKVADLMDFVIVGMASSIPVQAVAMDWLKEKLAERKRKEAEKNAPPAPNPAPPAPKKEISPEVA